MAGKHHNHGTITLADKKIYAFRGATIKPDSKGPKSKGFVACTMSVMVSVKVFDRIMAVQDGDEEPEEVSATELENQAAEE